MKTSTSSRMVHFLLVEDDDDHADLVRRAFDHNKIVNTLERVSDGVQALDYLNQLGEYADAVLPDVILLDLNLPKISGLELLAKIKSDEKMKRIPVVIMTTSTCVSDTDKAYEHHVNSFLSKPIDFEKFQLMIHDLNMYWSVWNSPASKRS
ncbi:MAG: response regulator [Phycisphaerales bacterium]